MWGEPKSQFLSSRSFWPKTFSREDQGARCQSSSANVCACVWTASVKVGSMQEAMGFQLTLVGKASLPLFPRSPLFSVKSKAEWHNGQKWGWQFRGLSSGFNSAVCLWARYWASLKIIIKTADVCCMTSVNQWLHMYQSLVQSYIQTPLFFSLCWVQPHTRQHGCSLEQDSSTPYLTELKYWWWRPRVSDPLHMYLIIINNFFTYSITMCSVSHYSVGELWSVFQRRSFPCSLWGHTLGGWVPGLVGKLSPDFQGEMTFEPQHWRMSESYCVVPFCRWRNWGSERSHNLTIEHISYFMDPGFEP